MNILCIDIGNTDTSFGIINNQLNILYKNRIPTSKLNINTIIKNLNKLNIDYISVCSVVPKKNKLIEKNKLNITPFYINHENGSLKLNIENPSEVGADRIANCYAAFSQYNQELIVIDFGSATTFDVISSNGEFIGGAICPGMDTAAKNLIEKAALLNSIPFQFPKNVIGKNTTENLQSGILNGTMNMVKGMIMQIQKELGMKNIKILITGGFGKLISDNLQIKHTFNSDLTILGVAKIYLVNTL